VVNQPAKNNPMNHQRENSAAKPAQDSADLTGKDSLAGRPFNYFNYFTEIEEYFWKKRGAHLLVSPLDWAILETWQKAGIPLRAVQKGIDRAFEAHTRSKRKRPVKSLAYCVDAVLDAAREMSEAAVGKGPEASGSTALRDTGFSAERITRFLAENANLLHRAAEKVKLDAQHSPALLVPSPPRRSDEAIGAAFEHIANELNAIVASSAPGGDQTALDVEDLERRLTVLEEKLVAAVTANLPEEELLEVRREMDRALAPYRRKMTAEQLALVERQYTQRKLFERFRLPRLSLFYLG
jgi:hypothetical protein